MTKDYEIVRTSTGALSIKDPRTGEIMHNPVGPWLESNQLYIEQSDLKNRLIRNEEIVLYDVGLGAAANAIAALTCLKNLKPEPARLKLISFEKDLSLLDFVLENFQAFDYYPPFIEALRRLAKSHFCEGENYSWTLIEDDFSQIELKARPDLVFYDPYSPKQNEEMWTAQVFEKIYQVCDPEKETLLFTYSRATKIRAALLNAGFYVGFGEATGLKEETTVASTQIQALKKPLDPRWLERFQRSHDFLPDGLSEEDAEVFREKILQHDQFK